MARFILMPSGQCLNLDHVHTLQVDSYERPIYTREGIRLPHAFVVNGDREGDVYPIIHGQDADALRA